jgi:hypothetical protein
LVFTCHDGNSDCLVTGTHGFPLSLHCFKV